MQSLLSPVGGEPMVLGAERFVTRLKEHASFLARLETRKRTIAQVVQELGKVEVKKGGTRRDLRFTEKRIDALVKELGYLPQSPQTSHLNCAHEFLKL